LSASRTAAPLHYASIPSDDALQVCLNACSPKMSAVRIQLYIAGPIGYIGEISKGAFLFVRRPSADYTRTNTPMNKIRTTATRKRNVIRRDRCA
jgi:hypothetical protein